MNNTYILLEDNEIKIEILSCETKKKAIEKMKLFIELTACRVDKCRAIIIIKSIDLIKKN